MKSKDFNPAREVILEEDFSYAAGRAKRISREESVNILKYSPNYVEIEAVAGESKFLILSDTYYPGWKAAVDEEPGKIYRADYILRAVYIKPGRHIVRFTYDPFSFRIGAIITLVTIGALLGLWIKRLL